MNNYPLSVFLCILLLQGGLCLTQVSTGHLTADESHQFSNPFGNIGSKIAAGVAGVGATAATAGAAVTGIGFTGSGIAAGSAAAGIQAGIGNVVAGSAFAATQSLAATGAIGLLGIAGGVAVVGGLGYLGYTYISAMNSKPS
jgi:hypothetical protein